MAFPLFLLLNFLFFIRPDEIITSLNESRLYLCCFLACLAFSWRELSVTLKLDKLIIDPVTCCIVLYGLIFTISNIINVGVFEAREQGIEYVKLVLYYLLFISLVNTPERLRIFLKCIVLCVLVMTAIVLLDHYEVIRVEAIEPIIQNEYDEEGAIIDSYPRLRYLGTFQDPNDLSMLLGVGMIISVYLYVSGASFIRLLWAIPFASAAFLMALTQSRGGLLGLAAGVAAYFASKLGWRKALPLAAIAIPALLFVVGGRQGNISLSGGTGQDRLRIWSDGFALMANPRHVLTGIGVNKYHDEVGHVAHNSYVHAFVETGIIGGILFSGVFLLAFGVVFKQGSAWLKYQSPVLAQMHPYLLAVLADYLVCMFSLSRNYVVTTYMMLGICTAFIRMAQDEHERSWYNMDFRMIVLICGLGLGVFAILKLFLMMFVQFGS